MAPAFFRQSGDGVFVAHDPARGPWSADHCHAGPVTGLIARAAEALAGPGRMLTRLTVDFLRPLPVAGLRVAAETGRDSRTLTTTAITVRGPDGGVCATATSMHLVRMDYADMPTAPAEPLPLDQAVPGAFPIRLGRHGLPMFSDFVETRVPSGQDMTPGPTALWMRAPALIEGETPSPVQSLCALADCGNAISRNAELSDYGFMNTDLTLQVHREPQSDWLWSRSVSHWQATGIGMSHSVLGDVAGPVAVALQTLVLRPASAG